MSTMYKVNIKPLEPYTFGTEQGSKYEGASQTGKESYIIASAFIPEQTTILGALRYIVLQNKGLLKKDFSYNNDEKNKIDKEIGAKSFAFDNDDQSFGYIESISPLFISNGEDIYIKNPFCNKMSTNKTDTQGFIPYELEKESILTSRGKIELPGKAYDVKRGYGNGYINLCNSELLSFGELFQKHLQTGNRADHINKKNKEGFFKREVVTLKEGFAFSVYVKADDKAFPERTIAYMGLKQSAFEFEFKMLENSDYVPLEETAEKAFIKFQEQSPFQSQWYYALSDIYAPDLKYGNGFAIVEGKKIRNIQTTIEATKYINKRKKSSAQVHLIESGSVFKAKPVLSDNMPEKYKNIGYNYIVKIGR